MVAEDIIGNLPFWMTITLFLSYLTWSKFLNNGKLRPDKTIFEQEVDALIVVSTIFVMYLVILYTIIITWYSWTIKNEIDWIKKFFDFSLSEQKVGLAIAFLDVVIILLLSKMVYEKMERKDLVTIFNYYFFGSLGLFSYGFGVLFYFISARIDYYVWPIVTWMTISAPLYALLYYLIGLGSRYFKDFFDFPNLRGKKISLFILIICMILGFASSWFITPKFSYDDEIQNYIFSDFDYNGLAKMKIKRTFSLDRLGGFNSLRLVSLDLGGLDLKDDESIRFSYLFKNRTGGTIVEGGLINLPVKEKNYGEYGIEDYAYSTGSNFLFRINKKTYLEKNISDLHTIGITTKDYDISDKFIVNMSQHVDCFLKNCTLNFSFKNKLDYPIYNKEIRFPPNEYIYFGKNCKIFEVGGGIYMNNKTSRIMFEELYKDEHNRTMYSFHAYEGKFDFLIWDNRLPFLGAERFEIGNNTMVKLNITQTCQNS